jgi:hypothetical protein
MSRNFQPAPFIPSQLFKLYLDYIFFYTASLCAASFYFKIYLMTLSVLGVT